MSVEIYEFVMDPPWAPLWVRGDVNLEDDDAKSRNQPRPEDS